MSRVAQASYDVVVAGGGHNGLTAAALLARRGLRTLVLERLPVTGGAAVSKQAFSGHRTRLSRYSYLVSLMPEALLAELDLDVTLRSRKVASYTPYLRDGWADGLLVERPEGEQTAAAFRRLTGDDREHAAWQRFYEDVGELAEALSPTLLQPLQRESELAARISPLLWRDLVRRPLGQTIRERFENDLIRGIVATDGLIGTFTDLDDPSLLANRCFLYHLIGNGTGEWRVPVGGMGAVSQALLRAALSAGAEVVTHAEVERITPGPDGAEVAWRSGSESGAVSAGTVLAGMAPWTLNGLLGDETSSATKPEGAQLKINFLLDRLPRLRSGVDPSVAFAGTLHLNEELSTLQRAHAEAAAGRVPAELPGEVYCHSLTDASILGGFSGHTLTYFGLHTPASLLDQPGARELAVERAIASLDQHLLEPLTDCVARDAEGALCIEAKTPSDIERDLGMPGGHIFHGDLEWPWVGERAALDSPAQRWGVATGHDRVLLCGSGARRGGAVSGIGGHNAAMAVLDALG